MELWGYLIDTTLEWLIFSVLLVLAVALYLYVVIFIRKYTTGMLGGFLLILAGLGLVLGPAFYLITDEPPFANMVLSAVAIGLGCISVLVGAYKLTYFGDF